MLATFVIAFLPGSKLQSPSTVILEPKKVKSVTASIFSASICHEVMAPDVMILDFQCWVSSWLFHSPLLPSRGSLVSLHFLPSSLLLLFSIPKVAQSCLTLCDAHGLYIRGILQARTLEWVAFSFSRVSSQPTEIEPRSPALQMDFLLPELQEIANYKRIPSTWLPSSLFKERKYWNSIHY